MENETPETQKTPWGFFVTVRSIVKFVIVVILLVIAFFIGYETGYTGAKAKCPEDIDTAP